MDLLAKLTTKNYIAPKMLWGFGFDGSILVGEPWLDWRDPPPFPVGRAERVLAGDDPDLAEGLPPKVVEPDWRPRAEPRTLSRKVREDRRLRFYAEFGVEPEPAVGSDPLSEDEDGWKDDDDVQDPSFEPHWLPFGLSDLEDMGSLTQREVKLGRMQRLLYTLLQGHSWTRGQPVLDGAKKLALFTSAVTFAEWRLRARAFEKFAPQAPRVMMDWALFAWNGWGTGRRYTAALRRSQQEAFRKWARNRNYAMRLPVKVFFAKGRRIRQPTKSGPSRDIRDQILAVPPPPRPGKCPVCALCD
jgi:hypothetical protein